MTTLPKTPLPDFHGMMPDAITATVLALAAPETQGLAVLLQPPVLAALHTLPNEYYLYTFLPQARKLPGFRTHVLQGALKTWRTQQQPEVTDEHLTALAASPKAYKAAIEERLVIDPQRLKPWLRDKQEVTMWQILGEAFGLAPQQWKDRRLQYRTARAMRACGWEGLIRRHGALTMRRWVPARSLPL